MFMHCRPGFRQLFRDAEGAAGAGGGEGGGAGAPGAAGAAGGAIGSGAPGAPGAPAPGASAGGGQQLTPAQAAAAFHESLLPGAARDLIVSKGFGNANEVVNAYHNANRVLGGATDVLTIPGEGSSPEQIAAFRGKLGIPETPAGYEFDLSKVKNVNEPMVEFGRKMFHEIGVPANQAQKALDMWEDFIGEQNRTLDSGATTANEAEVAKIRSDLGAGADEFFANAKRAVAAMGMTDESLGRLEAAAGSGAIVELMGKIGKGLSEGSFIPGGGSGADDALASPEAAQAEIKRLQGSEEFQKKFLTAKHPEHGEALKRMEALFAATTAKKPG